MPPKPIPVRRLFAVSWVMSRAFTSNRFLAVLAFPTAVLSLVPYVARRTVYESPDRNGMVIFARHNLPLDIVLALPIAAGMGIVTVIVLLLGPTLGGFYWAVVFVVVVGLGCGAGQFISAASLTSAVGKETPPGDRWAVMALSQRPGTRLSALLLTRALIKNLPPGAVVVATAGSPELAHGYQRLGLTPGHGARLHRVV
ncbi:hypothetical protein [Microbacterium marinilacus]|uniref:Uncharacterized protein n=1 Tax=Microbacterium marinilacus TaxID=415209 RepID=A0ABP7BM25_9MICO|nr:hypothetical protein [Microbacterium marinilacus]MBY0688424.1 hypothetical protein [Microbacterium marinilacus]